MWSSRKGSQGIFRTAAKTARRPSTGARRGCRSCGKGRTGAENAGYAGTAAPAGTGG
ncbi:hypothetical protein ebA2904 [Aromatoleum aromaticum EbN1]|uniref:Uncharacterized protein n=1 Tax=Aromatoleum aromaticum (strain DSM 19018 / LMG 30748 / EbN1) TaxID=76114 RepID=Q5P4K4_AROAE|nr:hypothetical protein ebA2904 [Aromatoleum aromaticum EbN1]